MPRLLFSIFQRRLGGGGGQFSGGQNVTVGADSFSGGERLGGIVRARPARTPVGAYSSSCQIMCVCLFCAWLSIVCVWLVYLFTRHHAKCGMLVVYSWQVLKGPPLRVNFKNVV